MMAWVSRRLCGLSGHAYVKAFAHDRIYLVCPCGHTTPGFEV